jgi:hypothetical protein
VQKFSEIGEYLVSDSSLVAFSYSKQDIGCSWGTTYDDSIFKSGKLTITKLEKFRRIISGTFYFTIENSCGKVEVTEGRFDLKY